jgi:hypothetical protein
MAQDTGIEGNQFNAPPSLFLLSFLSHTASKPAWPSLLTFGACPTDQVYILVIVQPSRHCHERVFKIPTFDRYLYNPAIPGAQTRKFQLNAVGHNT